MLVPTKYLVGTRSVLSMSGAPTHGNAGLFVQTTLEYLGMLRPQNLGAAHQKYYSEC
jgi:hypothetical protein